MMNGRALVDRGLQALDHRFARRHAERAAHEIEILHADHDRQPVELAEAELDGVVGAGLGARVLEAVGVAALVAELERIERHLRDRDIEPGLVVEHRLEARRRAHAHVVVGAGDDELVGLDVLVEHELAGLRALDPEIFRRLAAREEVADFRPDDVGDPVHGYRLCPTYMDCRIGSSNDCVDLSAAVGLRRLRKLVRARSSLRRLRRLVCARRARRGRARRRG